MKWEQIEGWYDWGEYYRSVVERYHGGILVEVGTYLGRSLCHLGTLVRESGKPFRVIGVDHCLGSGVENGFDHHLAAVQRGGRSFAGELWNNVVACGLQDIVSLIVAESGVAAQLLPNDLTMVFLDEGHDYASVCRGIDLWSPKIVYGGELAGDDFGTPDEPRPVWPGVSRAVKDRLTNWRCVPHDAWAWTKRSQGQITEGSPCPYP